MKRNNHTYEKIDWLLSCTYAEAVNILTRKVDTNLNKWFSDIGNIKGIIKDNKIEIWYKAGGRRINQLALGKLELLKDGDNARLKGIISISSPYRYFNFPIWVKAVLYTFTGLAWLSFMIFLLFPTNRDFSFTLIWPVMALMFVSVMTIFRYMAANELTEIVKFVERALSNYKTELKNTEQKHSQ